MSRRKKRWYYKPTQPIQTQEGIKARSKSGKFAENWWARRWIAALERITDAGRLRRGKRYAQQGQVLSIEEKDGAIHALVQGSRKRPYKVTIRLQPLSSQQWEAVLNALSEQAIFTAQLLTGEMPQDIETAFAQAGVSLFPNKSTDLETHCSCPDWANPCKHVAATHYILAEQFDEDPFLLFRLRGMSQEALIEGLRSRRAEPTTAEDARESSEQTPTAPPLEESLTHFWRLAAPLDHFPTAIREPVTPMPILRRLGQPSFAQRNIEHVFAPLYEEATRQALRAAYGEEETQKEDPDSK